MEFDAGAEQPRLKEAFEWLHRHPEIANREVKTTSYIRSRLTERGIRILDSGLSTGLVAEIGPERPAHTIALRADIDALPIAEDTGLSYASENPGFMHACGHDFHTAALLGAAGLLKDRESELPGAVRLVFQPAEEVADGAESVMRAGALEGVEAIFGIHCAPNFPVGSVGLLAGRMSSSVDDFRITLRGAGGHAAHPDEIVDPVTVASLLIVAFQTIVSRNVNPFSSCVLSVPVFQSGKADNVFDDSAVLAGTVRTFDSQARLVVQRRVKELLSGFEIAFGVSIALEWLVGTPSMDNDARWAEHFSRCLRERGYDFFEKRPSMGAEDFAVYQQQIPGVFFSLGTGSGGKGHTSRFQIDEAALPFGARLYCDLAACALEELSRRDFS
jgi:amidohydrolase